MAVENPEAHIKPGQTVIEVDPRYFRPTEVDLLIGDAAKAREKLGWRPQYTLNSMIDEMVQSDLELFRKDILLKKGGYDVIRGVES
jgi:GDPmannose 4,6-dehydratase